VNGEWYSSKNLGKRDSQKKRRVLPFIMQMATQKTAMRMRVMRLTRLRATTVTDICYEAN